jgi:phosphate-selective porin OprO/OprP
MLLGGTVEAQTPLAPSQPVDGAELPAAPIAATPLPAAELQAAELPAAAAPTLDGLHDELRQLRSEVAALKQAQSPLPSPPELQPAPSAAVERPSFRISPELQLDNYFFGQNTESRNTVGNIPDGAAFRRARIAVLGDYKQTEYRLEMDFAQPGRPSFLDVWGAINDLPYVGQLKIGNFFEPIGLERLTSNRFAPFLERNLPDQPFDPQRNPGIAIQNEYGNQRGLYTLGVFRPRIDAYDDAVTDTGDWAFDGRFTFMPFYDEASGGRYYMHLGTAHSYRRTTNHTISFAAQPEARLGASVPNVPFFIATGDIDAVDYLIHEVEFAWSLGSVYLQAEYFWLPVGRINGPDLMFTGWYAQIGWYLTGEHRPFRRETGTFDRVLPFTEFFRARTRQGVVQGCGAWELAARISQCDLTDRDVGGGKLTDLTVGLNWYLTPYMRLQTNYIHAFLDPAAASNTGADIIGTRMQYDF